MPRLKARLKGMRWWVPLIVLSTVAALVPTVAIGASGKPSLPHGATGSAVAKSTRSVGHIVHAKTYAKPPRPTAEQAAAIREANSEKAPVLGPVYRGPVPGPNGPQTSIPKRGAAPGTLT